MKEHFSPCFAEGGGNPTEHTDEEGLVDQFVALRIEQVELERQASSFLPLLVAVLQQACKTETSTLCQSFWLHAKV